MNDKKFFIASVAFLIVVIITAITDYDYISMAASFIAMAFCFWYIKTELHKNNLKNLPSNKFSFFVCKFTHNYHYQINKSPEPKKTNRY